MEPPIANDVMRNEIRSYIRDWISIDDEISPKMTAIDQEIKQLAIRKKQLMSQKKILEEKKTDRTQKIVDIIKIQQVDSINFKGGKLVYKKKVTRQSITKKFLYEFINNFYKNDANVLKLTDHILDSRGEKVTETIVRKSG